MCIAATEVPLLTAPTLSGPRKKNCAKILRLCYLLRPSGLSLCYRDIMATFEGSEKRIEVSFSSVRCIGDQNTNVGSLRMLPRKHLDMLMDDAECKIISSRSSSIFDAYVLSESSLFVYDTRYILKTCGTTKLLDSIPRLLGYAQDLGLEPVHVRFSRASFLFPDKQVRETSISLHCAPHVPYRKHYNMSTTQ